MRMRLFTASFLLSAALVASLAAGAPHAFAAEEVALPQADTVHFSHNWSGYVADDTAYAGVRGSWVVPEASPADDDLSANVVWIGIGGSRASDLIQLGTQALSRNGATTYHAWYETLPDAARELPVAVSPGDAVSASLQEELPNLWHLIFSNDTTGIEYETYVYYVSNNASAEWIVERPFAITDRDEGYLPLSDFGTVSFTDASATTAGGAVIPFSKLISSQAAEPVLMDRSHSSVQATPSALDGDGFAVSYLETSEGKEFLRDLKRRYREAETRPAPVRELPVQTITPASGTVIIRVVF